MTLIPYHYVPLQMRLRAWTLGGRGRGGGSVRSADELSRRQGHTAARRKTQPVRPMPSPHAPVQR